MRNALVLVVALALAACGKSDSKKDEPGKGGGGGGGGGAAKTATVKIKLGLQADVMAGATAGDSVVGGEGATITLPNGVIVSIDPAGENDPKTADDAKTEAADYSPQNLKAETLPDGWLVTYDNTGSMGANYFVVARRTIGGKDYKCSTTVSNPGQRDAGVATCKALRQ